MTNVPYEDKNNPNSKTNSFFLWMTKRSLWIENVKGDMGFLPFVLVVLL